MSLFKAEYLHCKDKIISPAYIKVHENGVIISISEKTPLEKIDHEIKGHVFPGLVNAHSHAFQYAFAGETEYLAGDKGANFWSWREKMYELALKISPEQLEETAYLLYSDMLRNGYTSVAEFHYLHHKRDGQSFDSPAEMSVRLANAANKAGINLVLIPIFYQKGGFEKGPLPEQRRFISKSLEDYIKLRDMIKKQVTIKVGHGIHSLRAISLDIIKDYNTALDKDFPFHIHLSEQIKEIEDCLSHTKKRPVEWLLENMELGPYSSLVHCTHLTEAEIEGLAAGKHNVVICPSTEANLGDGFFPLQKFKNKNGQWSIGSDSHIGLNPFEELRWLEYQVRLQTKTRVPLCEKPNEQAGCYLFSQAFFNGHRSLGEQRQDYFEIGKSFDAIYLESDALRGEVGKDFILSKMIFHSSTSSKLKVISKGKLRT